MWWYCAQCRGFLQGSERPSCALHGPASGPYLQPAFPTDRTHDSATSMDTSEPLAPSSSSPKLEAPADEHWYVDDEMELLAQAYNNGSFAVLPPVMGTDLAAVGGSELWGRLRQHQEERQRQFVPRNRVFIPVNLGNRHWVGLCLTYNPHDRNAAPAVEYFDSLAHAMDSDVQLALLRIFPGLSDVSIPGRRLQDDGHNCGPWVIEWFRALVAGARLDASRDMRAARGEHTQAPGMAALRVRLQREEEVRQERQALALQKELERQEREEMQRLRMPLGFGERAWFSPLKTDTPPRSTSSGSGFVFFDSRKKCQRCERFLELDKYATGRDWFSTSRYDAFLCGWCANSVSDQIKPCTDCGRLYWGTQALNTCADCTQAKHYQSLAGGKVVSGPVMDAPEHHAGKLAEVLFARHIEAQTGLKAVTVSSQHGIDLVIVTVGDDAYDQLMTCINGAPPPTPVPVRAQRTTVKKPSRGTVIHCFELKVNDAQFSAAQRDPDKFVESRLKRALEGKYGTEAQEGAKRLERHMNRGADWACHRINVRMPRNGSREYLARQPILAIRYNWGGTGNLGGVPQTIVPHCDAHSYMDSGWIGDTGEALAIVYLRGLGFDLRGAVQNSVGNGVDLVARIEGPPTAAKWAFFEIKTSTVKFETSLSDAEGEQWLFVMDRINKALLERDKYVNLRDSNLPGLMVANELHWDFKRPEDWRDKALYFHLMVRLPDPGTRGTVSFKLVAWPRSKKETRPLDTRPIPQPFAVFFTPPPTTTTTGVQPLVMLEHPRGGRFFPRTCEAPKCGCFRFAPSPFNSALCINCGHAHPS